MNEPYLCAGPDRNVVWLCERDECLVTSRRGGLEYWTADVEGMTLEEVTVLYTEHIKGHTEEER